MRKIKHIFRERNETGHPKEKLLVASQDKGVVSKKEYGLRTVEATKNLHLLKLVNVGDFVISLRSFQGGIEYAWTRGIISPAYTVLIPDIHNPHYLRYLLKCNLFKELLRNCVTGIREGQNIDYKKLQEHYIPIPPPEEQDLIIKYIDNLSVINELIGFRPLPVQIVEHNTGLLIQKINFLKLLRTRLISDAVTGAIDVRDYKGFEREI